MSWTPSLGPTKSSASCRVCTDGCHVPIECPSTPDAEWRTQGPTSHQCSWSLEFTTIVACRHGARRSRPVAVAPSLRDVSRCRGSTLSKATKTASWSVTSRRNSNIVRDLIAVLTPPTGRRVKKVPGWRGLILILILSDSKPPPALSICLPAPLAIDLSIRSIGLQGVWPGERTVSPWRLSSCVFSQCWARTLLLQPDGATPSTEGSPSVSWLWETA